MDNELRGQAERMADSFRRLIGAIERGELVASTATRYRLEGALVALEALLGDAEALGERLGLVANDRLL